jgi:hypothetical protein
MRASSIIYKSYIEMMDGMGQQLLAAMEKVRKIGKDEK